MSFNESLETFGTYRVQHSLLLP